MAEPQSSPSIWSRLYKFGADALSAGSAKAEEYLAYGVGTAYSWLPEGMQTSLQGTGLTELRKMIGAEKTDMILYATIADSSVDAAAAELMADERFKGPYEEAFAAAREEVTKLLGAQDPRIKELLANFFSGSGQNMDEITDQMVDNVAKKMAVATITSTRDAILANEEQIKAQVIPIAFAEKAKDPNSWAAAKDHWLWGSLMSIASYFTGRSVEELALWADNGFSEEAAKQYVTTLEDPTTGERVAATIAARVAGENHDRIIADTATKLLKQGMPPGAVAEGLLAISTNLKQQVTPGYATSDAEKAALLAQFNQQAHDIAAANNIPVSSPVAPPAIVAPTTPAEAAPGAPAETNQPPVPADRTARAALAAQHQEFAYAMLGQVGGFDIDEFNKLTTDDEKAAYFKRHSADPGMEYAMLDSDAQRMLWIRDKFPDATFSRDDESNLLITMKDGQTYYHNAPGWSRQDGGNVVAGVLNSSSMFGTGGLLNPSIPQAHAAEGSAIGAMNDSDTLDMLKASLQKIGWMEAPVLPDDRLADITRQVAQNMPLSHRDKELLRKGGITAEDISYALATEMESRNPGRTGLEVSDASASGGFTPPPPVRGATPATQQTLQS